MSAIDAVEVLLFDVFGTLVDWRSSLIDELTGFGREKGIAADWTALVDAWRGAYFPSLDRVRHGELPWMNLDQLHRDSLDRLIEEAGIEGLDEADRRHLTRAWHRLRPWPDTVAGLTRLKRRFILAPLSNGNMALMTNLAKHAELPWDCVLSAELFRHYKPDPETYLGAAALLDRAPGQVMLVAAHNSDLKAAASFGLRTAFIPRPAEYGPHQKKDFEAEPGFDLVAKDLPDLAAQLGL